MPKHMPLSDDEIETRSVLMRLYHSHFLGEDSYPVAFVNGQAPHMKTLGWIEERGDGWHITDAGIDAWAMMNQQSLGHRWAAAAPIFKELRTRLNIQINEGGSAVDKKCKKDGCENPRHVSISGNPFSYCHEHQKEAWAEAKRDKSVKQSGEPVVAAQYKADLIVSAFEVRMIEAEPLPMDVQEINVAEATLHGTETQDCEDCYAKAVVDALRAKSPKLAKLIDAMEQEQRAAHDLGL